MTDGRWYLVQCKPRESFRAEANLNNQGYRCFHPTYPVKRKIAGSIHAVIAPLFPHYLFILLDSTENWSTIRSTRGVSRIVYFNGVPASLSHNIVEGIQRQCERLHGKAAEPMFTPGQRVLITEGCFKDIEAMVTATTGEERVCLLINLFNREQHVELPVYAVAG